MHAISRLSEISSPCVTLKAKSGTKYPRFTFNYVMMNQNIHEAPLFVRMAQMLGGEAVDFRHMVPVPFAL